MNHLQCYNFSMTLSTSYFDWKKIFECITISFCLFFYDSIAFLLDCNQPTLIGDGYCNDEVNILDCGFDGGDCCGSCIITDFCTNCSCIGGVTGNDVLNARVDALVGDGFCHDMMNNPGCNYDHGDCCLSNVTTNHCSNCTCHLLETCVAGYHPSVGDGYCNDVTNIQQCNFDGGDCCGSCINIDLCTNCSCLGNITGNGVPNALVGDGYCNDKTNNVHCLYDGLDCCRSPVNTDSCFDCLCHGESTILQNLSFLL